MKRRAILLVSHPVEHVFEHACRDSDLFSNFLMSEIGGGWREAEISQHTNPSRNLVLSSIDEANDSDYTLVYFIGKGSTQKMGRPWAEFAIHLNSEMVSERELNSGAQRMCQIFDCTLNSQLPEGNQLPALSPRPPRHTGRQEIFRDLYENSLKKAEQGIVKLLATGHSTDISSFTALLISETRQWALHHKGVLSLNEAIDRAKASQALQNPNVIAEYNCGRRLHDFPFAIQR
jgi:hypothetical protein